MANGIPMAIQDLYQQLELEGGEGVSNDFVLPWDRALQDSGHTQQADRRSRSHHAPRHPHSTQQKQ